MASISTYITNIRNAIFGKDVRSSIADGLDAMNTELTSTTSTLTSTVSTLNTHKTATTLDHPDGSVTDAKIGTRTMYSPMGTGAETTSGVLTTLLNTLATSFRTILAKLNDHINGVDYKHSADKITYSGDITAATEVKGAINTLNSNMLEKTGYGVYSGLAVTAQTTPNMTVNVASGVCYMPTYGTRYAPVANASLAVSTADTTLSRTDIVYVNSSGVTSYLAGTITAVAGSRTYTITTNAKYSTSDTITLCGVTLSVGTTLPTSTTFPEGLDIATTVSNIAAALNLNTTITSIYTVTSSGTSFTLTEKVAGGGNTPTVATYTGTVVISNGTATTSGKTSTTASLPTGGIKLAELTVLAGATSITSANITDKRKFLWTEAWQTPTLLNGWASYFSTFNVGYRKNVFDRVEIVGSVKSGTVNATLFTLPVGYRPTHTSFFITNVNSNNPAYVVITYDGVVTIMNVSDTTRVSLDGISFSTN